MVDSLPKSLSDILNNLKSNDNLAFQFAGFEKRHQNLSISYNQLKSKLETFKLSTFKLFNENKNSRLFAIFSNNWDLDFYLKILGIIANGDAFLVIDLNWPEDYIENAIRLCAPNFLIIDQFFCDKFNQMVTKLVDNYDYTYLDDSIIKTSSIPDCRILHNHHLESKIQDLAYVIFTSGTSGSPKIISVCNSSIVPNIIDFCKLVDLCDTDTIYSGSSLTFDPSIIEIFCCLYSGCKNLVLPQNLKLQTKVLMEYISSNKVTVLQLTPTLFQNIIDQLMSNFNVRVVLIGGEVFPNMFQQIKYLMDKNIKIFNIYGITEISCWASYHLVDFNDLQ
jgi:non-ribosomal peptide synthetase component F